MALRWFGVVLVVCACGGAAGPSSPAADGVRAYIQALHGNDPHGAYALLSSDARKQISYDEFTIAWKQGDKERAWQAKALEDSLKGDPDVGERALISFPDGKLVQLEREGKSWRLENELVSRSRAKQPRDAVRMFAEAVAGRDITGMLNVLTKRRREGLTRQVEGFVAGIGKRVNNQIDQLAADRAELRWDENGLRYRIILRKENDEWRVDDIYIRPTPRQGDSDRDGESSLPDEF